MRSEKEIVEECVATYEARKSARAPWDAQWQMIADYFCPRKASITNSSHLPDGQKEAQIYDGSGYYALDVAVRGQTSDIIPHDQVWFSFDPPPGLAGDFRVQQWCQQATRLARLHLSASKFYPQSYEFVSDRTCFGTACLYSEESDADPNVPVVFRHHRIGSYTMAENADGVVDSLDFEKRFTARQLVEKFGRETVSAKVRECFDAGRGKQDTQFTVLHCIYPRAEAERIIGKMDGVNKPFASVWMEKDAKQPLRVAGYDEMPFSVSRWSTWEGNEETAPYGYSPAFMALPDMRQLNLLQKCLDVLAEKKANPPLLIPTGFKGDIDYRAGGITWFDPATGDAARPQAWGMEGDYGLGVQRADQKRSQIEAFFQVNMWLAISRMERANITAEEVRARVGEQARQFAATYTLLVTEWLTAQLMRFFRILLRRGILPSPPREMISSDGRGNLFIPEPQVLFSSRIALALKEADNTAVGSVLSLVGSIAQMAPDVMDNFNLDEMIRGSARNRGLPPEYNRDPDEVAAMRAARAQAQQQAQQADAVEQMSRAAANAGKIPKDSPMMGLLGER
ncbi:portal protein [Roseimicrobium sp. ORNL1]|uniref:portal protein n=1 Tax=Roseimicrobium sp. ORNL1 TaxID=2711231 RepID=UPI0013E2074C|nr:portal protein [Roseimicrobium sp. ORNL1]QIF01936.1 hypothetical protein G5S37_10475 [Roseimicrobium sp. ORNL1]